MMTIQPAEMRKCCEKLVRTILFETTLVSRLYHSDPDTRSHTIDIRNHLLLYSYVYESVQSRCTLTAPQINILFWFGIIVSSVWFHLLIISAVDIYFESRYMNYLAHILLRFLSFLKQWDWQFFLLLELFCYMRRTESSSSRCVRVWNGYCQHVSLNRSL